MGAILGPGSEITQSYHCTLVLCRESPGRLPTLIAFAEASHGQVKKAIFLTPCRVWVHLLAPEPAPDVDVCHPQETIHALARGSVTLHKIIPHAISGQKVFQRC